MGMCICMWVLIEIKLLKAFTELQKNEVQFKGFFFFEVYNLLFVT